MSEFASGEVLAHAVELARLLSKRYMAGFDDTNRTRQAPGLPNHFAWQLGHLAFYLNRVAEKIDGKPIPAEDFIAGDHGTGTAFAIESVAFASNPTDDPSRYPSAARCTQVFDRACERLAGALRRAGPEKIREEHPWGVAGTSSTVQDLTFRMLVHTGMHTGQLTDLRRALNLGSIFK